MHLIDASGVHDGCISSVGTSALRWLSVLCGSLFGSTATPPEPPMTNGVAVHQLRLCTVRRGDAPARSPSMTELNATVR